ncbi:KamA family radical SAM protein [Desulfoplanes formicivorans]|uniref:L-lysine 2,3-aminomutase n=1 Tax=Desulfoplanes formicivorans TaxID=1592317 RepID=A0A194AIG6_9BACT|nr:KamA family radical SAM protein [Desulfoplanes formicivorans]GAU09877.1 lysine 2,3-aminomutase [Desulfoplanes formicivorans]
MHVLDELEDEPPDCASSNLQRGMPREVTEDRFMKTWFPGTGDRQWNDWHWQIRNRITDAARLHAILGLCKEEMAASREVANMPLAVTPYYLRVIVENAHSPLRKCVVPSSWEHLISPHELTDPLGEDTHSPVPGIVHRYPDRVLLLATDFCSTYCRYCTRSRLVGRRRASCFGNSWKQGVEYIRSRPEIRDVLISGGDPLTMCDEHIERLLLELRSIPHVEIVRLGTKVPAVLPQRITPSLVRILRKAHPLYLSLHFTHPHELTPACKRACELLADGGIPLGSQTVLLAGVNDDVTTMKRLMQGLLRFRVRPYYLYQCDPIPGSSHFRTPVATGLEIIRGLRGHTSGYAVPQYVIDAPGGGGKIPLLPKSEQGLDALGNLVLKNYEGKLFTYPEACGPMTRSIFCPEDAHESRPDL